MVDLASTIVWGGTSIIVLVDVIEWWNSIRKGRLPNWTHKYGI